MSENWHPSCEMMCLKQRDKVLRKIRQFFYDRDFTEVETPLLATSSVTEPHIASFATVDDADSNKATTYYLQTSPEYAMKRLLCQGSGSIFQISKAFRQREHGKHHNPEFSLLEWYQVGFDHQQLMTQVDDLLQTILNSERAERYTYQDIFVQCVGINPHDSNIETLQDVLANHNIQLNQSTTLDNYDLLLQLIMSHIIEPTIGKVRPIMIYDFPKSQAALAKIRDDDCPVAERFEVYYQGLELANGFHELGDPQEQQQRFVNDNQKRLALGLNEIPIDEKLIRALAQGLPDCAGVALGIDRLMMLALQKGFIQEVISFDWERA